MSDRFFIDKPIGETATLAGAEAHHLLHVMRARVGDTVTLFDGSGVEYAASIAATRRSEVACEITERHEVDRELPFELTMGVALPKGDRQKFLIEKLTELGVTRVVPLVTERSVAAPKASAMGKLRRGVIEASKQCGRNRLMVIDEPVPLADFLAADHGGAAPWFAHPGMEPLVANGAAGDAVVAVGPEGGFSDPELAAALESGWQAFSLGARILRIETAAQAIAAVLGCANAPPKL